ncbi:MAG: type II secretion system F family protein [Pseudomonadota bacterium]
MTLYVYKAVNQHGVIATGLQDAANEMDLEVRLKQIGLALITARINNSGIADALKLPFGLGKIRRTDLITFFFNLEQLSSAGVPLLDSLADLRDSMDAAQFHSVISSMVEAIQDGATLSQAMAQHPRAFDQVLVSLIAAGEASGRLELMFRQITNSLKWQDELAVQTKNMMIYPVIITLTVTAITFFLMIYLVPQLAGFINALGQSLPLQTRVLLATSGVFVHYWYLIAAFPPGAYILFRLALKFRPDLHYPLDRLKLKLRPIGPILQKIILARFAHTCAMMYSSGIGILDCLANSRNLANNQVISFGLEQVAEDIAAGKNLTQSFADTGLFPPLVIRMIKVGETTGQLDLALLNISYFYDRDVKDAIKKVQIMIEPTMTIIVGLLLAWVMLSVLTPIYDIIAKVKV